MAPRVTRTNSTASTVADLLKAAANGRANGCANGRATDKNPSSGSSSPDDNDHQRPNRQQQQQQQEQTSNRRRTSKRRSSTASEDGLSPSGGGGGDHRSSTPDSPTASPRARKRRNSPMPLSVPRRQVLNANELAEEKCIMHIEDDLKDATKNALTACLNALRNLSDAEKRLLIEQNKRDSKQN